ncbi:hypothetical protein QBC34DRAFT_81395 [Podospora aff. communis PSN243]|uniref:Uncharacterized protein n=1 Tax=Podospora aff. communis PSN243 TaxID=3040156 RepID=A0AAV9GQ56_9PEZI|nr:hypothetical protein QBC34DRAFT_81395 [Podospora aff. communis PSN243]
MYGTATQRSTTPVLVFASGSPESLPHRDREWRVAAHRFLESQGFLAGPGSRCYRPRNTQKSQSTSTNAGRSGGARRGQEAKMSPGDGERGGGWCLRRGPYPGLVKRVAKGGCEQVWESTQLPAHRCSVEKRTEDGLARAGRCDRQWVNATATGLPWCSGSSSLLGAYKMEHANAPGGDGGACEGGRRMAEVEGMREHAPVSFDLISRSVDGRTSNGQRKLPGISLGLAGPRDMRGGRVSPRATPAQPTAQGSSCHKLIDPP